MQHLLDHTAGLPDDAPVFPEGGLWVGFEPGRHWSYSNTGYRLAGMIAEQAGGSLYPALVQERILDRLGMKHTVSSIRVADRPRYPQGYEPALTDRLNPHPGAMTPTPWEDYDGPAGCLAATAGDMTIFLRFLLGLAGGKGGSVLSDAAAKRFLANPVDGWDKGAKYGNGIARVEIDGRRYLHHTGGMVNFCSALHVDADAGVAAFASSNIHYALDYRPVRVTTHACEVLRAVHEKRAAPVPKPPTPPLERAGQYAGVFSARDGDRFEVIADGGKLGLRRRGTDNVLQQVEDKLFATTEPDFAVRGVVFEIAQEKAVRAWIGDVEYTADPAAGYKPSAAPELRALAGRYDNESRPLYVYARDGGIWIGNAKLLVALGANEWRFEDQTNPERFRFDGFINGRPHRLLYSGTPYLRAFS